MKKKYFAMLLAGCLLLMAPTGALAADETVSAADEAAGEETETPAETGSSDTKLGTDIYSFQIEINGDVIKVPSTYEELTAMGWEIGNAEELETMVGSNTYTWGTRFNKGTAHIDASMLNLGINEAPVSECLVGGLTVETGDSENSSSNVVRLPGGIELGTADIDAIKAAYGEPSSSYEGDYYTELTYEKDLYEEVVLTVDKETNVLSEIELRNFVEPEGFDAGDVSTETPSIVTEYQAPSAPGENLLDPVVQFMGDLYQLPAPVSAFVDNGWTIMDQEEGTYAAGDGLEFIDMMKDNQTVRFSVYNYTENAVLLENCFVEELSFGTYDPEVMDLRLPGDVTLGMDKSQLMSMAEEQGYLCEEDGDYLTIYQNEDTAYDTNINFWFNKDENPDQVASITVHHSELSGS